MDYKTLEEILYNGTLEQDDGDDVSVPTRFVKSLEDKEVLKKEAKKASKLATELSESFASKQTKI